MAPQRYKVYIGGLGNSATEEEIGRIYSKYGDIDKLFVARRPPGFAFVEYLDRRDAEDAVRDTDNTEMCGHTVTVQLSHGLSRWPGGRPPAHLLRERAPRHVRSPPPDVFSPAVVAKQPVFYPRSRTPLLSDRHQVVRHARTYYPSTTTGRRGRRERSPTPTRKRRRSPSRHRNTRSRSLTYDKARDGKSSHKVSRERKRQKKSRSKSPIVILSANEQPSPTDAVKPVEAKLE